MLCSIKEFRHAVACVQCVVEHLRKRMIAFKKFRIEPGQRLGSLSCPGISRPHTSSPREPQGKALGHALDQDSVKAVARVEKYSPPVIRFPTP